MSVQRFLDAQNAPADIGGSHTQYQQAEIELANGLKKSHWVWYIFPQRQGLSTSAKGIYYAIADEAEAVEYMQDAVLRSRYLHMIALVMSHREYGRTLEEMLGPIDAVKFRASLSLFVTYI
jgi:uncharacterized protein (DUF1810 family)